MHAKLLQLCPTLCDPVDLAHQAPLSGGILQARILEWVAMPFPGYLPNPGIKPVSLMYLALAGKVFTTSVTWEAYINTLRYTHSF